MSIQIKKWVSCNHVDCTMQFGEDEHFLFVEVARFEARKAGWKTVTYNETLDFCPWHADKIKEDS